jgi:2,4-diaminopentanoate dehydrogenase
MSEQSENRRGARRYRVVQWATGNVGSRALRRAIEHPQLDLVGVYVYAADKVGRDAGELAGMGPVGVAATNRIESVMGFGQPPGRPMQARLDHLRNAFGPSLQLVAKTVGLPLERVEVSGGVGIARKDTRIAAGLVPAGTVAAMRTVVSGIRGGKPLLSFTATWYVSSDVDTDDGEQWEFRASGWRVLVRGDVPLDVSITYPVAPEDYAGMTPGLTAHIPLNAVRYVCEAPAGIRTSVDLPRIVPQLSAD